MTSDTMVRVGRGGAGNYHSAPVNKDAVPLAPSKSQVARATQPASAPTLTGRGGAGNWHDTTTADAAQAKNAEEVQQSAQAQKEATAHVDGELRRPQPTHNRIRHCERRHNR